MFSTRSLLHADHGDGEHHEGEYVMPVVAIFVIFLLGMVGSLVPPLIAFYMPKFDLNNRYGFRFFNGLAAGVVLGVAFIHSIPEGSASFEFALADREGDAASYPWAGLLAMLGVLATFICEEFVHRNIGRFAALHGHEHGDGHGHDHAHHHGPHHHHAHHSAPAVTPGEESKDVSSEMSAVTIQKGASTKDLIGMEAQSTADASELSEELLGYYTELYVLLFGLTFHSFFVGLALGVAGDDWGLFAAIVFHQFFEGLALGARVARAGFKSKMHIWILDIVYALAIPVGVAIGIAIQSAVVDDSFSYGIANGFFQGISGGILIYVALIHMMKEETSRPEFKNGNTLLIIMYFGFFIGAGVMAVIGIWA